MKMIEDKVKLKFYPESAYNEFMCVKCRSRNWRIFESKDMNHILECATCKTISPLRISDIFGRGLNLRFK